jgi:hypothetical protein
VASVILFVAAVVDLILFVILIGVSGFLFGTGPQSLHGRVLMATVYTVGVIGCLAAPVAGLVLHRYGKTAAGMLIAWLPPVGALIMIMIRAPY